MKRGGVNMKRGTDHTWKIVKYKDDIALYAKCKCGYRYVCSKNKRNEDGSWSFEQEINLLHRYCPYCGVRKKYYDDNVINIEKYSWEL